MNGSLLLDAPAAPYPASRRDITTVPLRGGRWRVTRRGGEVVGYLERIADGPGVLYRGSRMRPRRDGFVTLGEYADPEDALDVLRG